MESASMRREPFSERLQFLRPDPNSTAIMESIDGGLIDYGREGPKSLSSLPPDVTQCTLTTEFTSMKLGIGNDDDNGNCYLLLDGQEKLKVSSADQFLRRLGCDGNRVKVVSVFGNTGDGKSHTLNQVFFNGDEMFKTSAEQDSCTLGVWAAYDPNLRVICLDTEGLLGNTDRENQRTRLLLKVLAISDIVIYRTRSERLHRDLFTFLGWASRAYAQHFQSALQSVGQRGDFGGSLSALGPAVVIFHETRHTQTLQASMSESAEDVLRGRFSQCKLDIEAFSSLRYVGIRTAQPPTDYSELRAAVQAELENTTVRSARHPQVVYNTLKALNDKFSGEIGNENASVFPDQYFTCPARCQSCDQRCESSMGHLKDNKPHAGNSRCRYQHQFGNIQYICKTCHANGKEVVVTEKTTTTNESSWFGLAKYAWAGSVIECSNCGEIYRSRQFWYGNKGPEDAAVRTEILHVWPGCATMLVSQNAAQKVWDGVTYFTEAVASVGAPPTRMLTSWVADQIAPKYWRPNHEMKKCTGCGLWFGSEASKHHCRSCGEGFCADCSSRTRPVPDRGWHAPVRVCDACYANAAAGAGAGVELDVMEDVDDAEVRVRKYGEAVVSTLSTVASVLEYPRGLIKDTVRPLYWVPDCEVTRCCCCDAHFGPRLMLHHCRDCGQGVCQECSTGRRVVLQRGWDSPVRVCNKCMKQD